MTKIMIKEKLIKRPGKYQFLFFALRKRRAKPIIQLNNWTIVANKTNRIHARKAGITENVSANKTSAYLIPPQNTIHPTIEITKQLIDFFLSDII